uniref:Uncharacterized protein n=1 Tax=Sphaerodactylus townsendi TaxID=933632 RepID=A0ACB8EC71_9SAUR
MLCSSFRPLHKPGFGLNPKTRLTLPCPRPGFNHALESQLGQETATLSRGSDDENGLPPKEKSFVINRVVCGAYKLSQMGSCNHKAT